jgi:hypothetical protein
LIIGEKIIEVAIRAIAKKFKLDKVLAYVEKPNTLDESVERLFNINQALATRITELESVAHPSRNFIVCEKCKQEVKEK